MGSDKETLSVSERLVAGSLAGVIAQSTIYPMEVSGRPGSGPRRRWRALQRRLPSESSLRC